MLGRRASPLRGNGDENADAASSVRQSSCETGIISAVASCNIRSVTVSKQATKFKYKHESTRLHDFGPILGGSTLVSNSMT